jgi:UDP-N-acetylmuramoyl-L-alanyl-D-glutamate--2,6-diaminopimelate ligase
VAVALEPLEGGGPEIRQAGAVPIIPVESLGQRASAIAASFYGDPSATMQVVGVTGTNGKTSVSHFIAQALNQGGACGLIGTLGSGRVDALEESGHTTPDAITLQRQLAQMAEEGMGQVVMEVSSHALDQGRANAVRFDMAVFTNLSHEHLDYHGDMAGYAEAKRRLLQMPGLRHAVINRDDEVGRDWLAHLPVGVEALSYGLEQGDIHAESLSLDTSGLEMTAVTPWGRGELRSPLFGRFNASNLLAALGALLQLEIPLEVALGRLARLTTVPGRMEPFGGSNALPLVVVDYAHTPDALEQVLLSLREHTRGKLWCLFGCGGERDRAKRPKMAVAAERLADRLVISDDNPRGEDPYNILEEIIAGLERPDSAYVVRDRAMAIEQMIELARPDDIILVAGKGHETTQTVGREVIPYSDRETVARLLAERGGAL